MKPKKRPLASLGKIMCYEPRATKANTVGVPNKTDMEQACDPHSHSGAWCNENHQLEKTLVPPASQQPYYNSQTAGNKHPRTKSGTRGCGAELGVMGLTLEKNEIKSVSQ